MKTILASALGLVLMALLAFWAVGSQPAQSTSDQEQEDVQDTIPSPSATPPADLETSIRDKLKSSISTATDNVVRRTRRAADASVSDLKTRMERLITSLDTVRSNLPDDGGVGIYVSPERHLVEIKMRATTDRSVRLQSSVVGEGYDAEPLGESIVESGHFSSIPRLLLWLSQLIREHIAEVRAEDPPDTLPTVSDG